MPRFDPFYDDHLSARAPGSGSATGLRKVVPVEPMNGPWSGSNCLGQSQQFAPDSANRQTILKLPEWGMPRMWTCTLSLSYNEAALADATVQFDIKAEVTIGAGGTTHRAVLDWRDGVQFSVPMNALDVIASYSRLYNVSSDLDLRLNVTLGHFGRSGNTPTYTQPFSVDAGANDFVTIPQFASRLLVVPEATFDAFASTTWYEFLYSEGNILNRIRRVSGDQLALYTDGMPIPPNARAIRVVVNGAAIASGDAVFLLDL